MGKCIFKSSTCSNVSFLLISLVAISDVSRSWYPPSKPRDVPVQPPTEVDFPSSNVQSPIYSAGQRDRPPASDTAPGVDLRWRTILYALSHPHEADCRAGQWYRDAR